MSEALNEEEIIDRKQFDKRRDFKNLLNPKQLQYIKDSFKENDINNKNELNIDQLKEALEKYGIDINNDESFQQLFDEIERNGKTSIDFDQLIDIITLKLSELDSMEQLEKIFLLYIGEDKSDNIEYKHLKRVCPYLSDEEIEELIKKTDKEQNGNVNYLDFYNMITKNI